MAVAHSALLLYLLHVASALQIFYMPLSYKMRTSIAVTLEMPLNHYTCTVAATKVCLK